MSYIIGITPSEVWTSTQTPPFNPGQRGSDYLGNEYLFVRADAGGVTQYYAAVVTSSAFVVDMIDTTNSAPGAQAGGIPSFKHQHHRPAAQMQRPRRGQRHPA